MTNTLFAVLATALGLSACAPEVTGTWTSSSSGAPGACFEKASIFDDDTSSVVRVDLVAPGHPAITYDVPCDRDGFSMDIPDGATELELTVGVYPGDWATAGATILPGSQPSWERVFTETVTGEDIDLGELVFE